jgi:hypothetical protein
MRGAEAVKSRMREDWVEFPSGKFYVPIIHHCRDARYLVGGHGGNDVGRGGGVPEEMNGEVAYIGAALETRFQEGVWRMKLWMPR